LLYIRARQTYGLAVKKLQTLSDTVKQQKTTAICLSRRSITLYIVLLGNVNSDRGMKMKFH